MFKFRYLLLFFVVINCKPKKEEPIKPKDNPYMDAIRISATAEHPNDTSLQAKISFDTFQVVGTYTLVSRGQQGAFGNWIGVSQFDSHEEVGEQRKPITIVANTIPTETILEIYGYVQKRKK